MFLFKEGSMNRLRLKNRIVRSATWEGMCTPEGEASRRLLELYRELVKGGVGLIISGYSYVRADGKQMPGKMGIDNDSLIPALQKLTDVVHDHGGRVFCQLVHAGGLAATDAPLAPSAKDATSLRAMHQHDIDELVAAFAAAAKRAQESGFDGLQLHGAHGYLINQFLSPLTNRRQDNYGGSLENRTRFLREVYQAVRREVGNDYPVTIKLTAADNIDGGFTLEEAVIVAGQLDAWGIDAIEVSSGTAAAGALSPVRQLIDRPEQEAYNADYARAIKQAVKAPVMVVGGIRSPAIAEELLKGGAVDFVALSRPLIREPDLVNRWQADATHRATCISCNGCFRPGLKEGGIRCIVV
ncbi:MAG: NADH:flavin oxidoreductase [Desulfuromonadales bacterium]|nr:NADH:flavin oxidoreductase [Desulfuromonadales bacterium]